MCVSRGEDMSVIKGCWGKSEHIGRCNSCHAEKDVLEISLDQLSFRLCPRCVQDLKKLLEVAQDVPKMKVEEG